MKNTLFIAILFICNKTIWSSNIEKSLSDRYETLGITYAQLKKELQELQEEHITIQKEYKALATQIKEEYAQDQLKANEIYNRKYLIEDEIFANSELKLKEIDDRYRLNKKEILSQRITLN